MLLSAIVYVLDVLYSTGDDLCTCLCFVSKLRTSENINRKSIERVKGLK